MRTEKLLKQYTLNRPYFQRLKFDIKITFEAQQSDEHLSKSASENIFFMIKNLMQSSLIIEQKHFTDYNIINLREKEILYLNENITLYNTET